jgi:hypothetical protein
MIAFLVILILTAIMVRYVRDHIEATFRGIYLNYTLIIIFLGILSTIVYTVDNEVFNHQVDLPGDAQYYYYGALSYLQTGELVTYYPNYERFIAAFLYAGHPILVRLAQLLLFVWVYSLSVLTLNWLKVSKRGLIYFSIFTALSGIYYGALVTLVRDWLILFAIVAVFFVLTYWEVFGKNIFNVGVAIMALLFLLSSLGRWLVFPLLVALLGELSSIVLVSKTTLRKKLMVIGGIIIVMAIILLNLDYILYLYQINVEQGVLLDMQRDLGGPGTRNVWSFFKTLLGPGLIRPLFPADYFLVWVPSHAAFYWWGTAVWYVNLLVSVPKILREPLKFMDKRGGRFLLLLFILVIGTYVLAYGSGIGMRKRAIFQLLYTLLVAATYYTPMDNMSHRSISLVRLNLPVALVRLAVLLAIIVGTILSVRG